MGALRRRLLGTIGATALTLLVLTACAQDAAPTGAPATSSSPTPASSTPAVEPSAEPAPSVEPAPTSATDGFLTWLELSRKPDADAACAGLTPELAGRMIAELNQDGLFTVSSCEEMITSTAELYRSLNQSADVDIAVQAETATDATLFVTYLASGDCGTVVMQRAGTGWILTEQSQECAG